MDLTKYARPGAITTVELYNYGRRQPWIKCGQIEIQQVSGDRGVTLLQARGPDGWTDPEHDSISIFSMELIGVEYTGMWHNALHLSAYLHPTTEAFRFPSEEYLAELKPSKCKRCKNHMIVPEGSYVPPSNPDVHNQICKYRLEITVSHETP